MRRLPPREEPPEKRFRRDLPRPEGPFDRLLRRRPERDPAPFIIGGTVAFLALVILLVFVFSSLFGGDDGNKGETVVDLPGITGRLSQIPGLPPGLVAASDFVVFETEGPVPATIGLPLKGSFEDPARLGFYTFLERRWQRLADVRLTEGNRLGEQDFSPVPQNLAVLQVVAQTYQVIGSLPAGGELHPDARLNILSPRDYAPATDGSVQGTATAVTVGGGVLLMPTVLGSAEHTAAVVNDILADEALRQQHIEALVTLVSDGQAHGIDLEYSLVDPALGPAFTDFVNRLAEELHKGNKRLSLTLPPPTGQRQAYDWKALGQAADIIRVLPLADPVDYWEKMPAALNQIVQDVDPRKVMLIISPFSVERTGDDTRPIGYRQAMFLAAETAVREPQDPKQIKPGVSVKLVAVNQDQGEGASPMRWSNDAAAVTFAFGGVQSRVVFIENFFSVNFKLEMVQAYGLGGVAVSDASGRSDVANVWPAVKQLVDSATVTLVRPNDDSLVPRWEAPDGGDLGVGTGTNILWIAPEEAKSYNIILIVSDGEKRFGRETSVEVGAAPQPSLTPVVTFPAETPTPVPTATRTPTPTPSPTAPPSDVLFDVGVQADGDDPDELFADPETTAPGSTVTYRIVIDNDGSVPLTITEIFDSIYGADAAALSAECAALIGEVLEPDDGDGPELIVDTGPDAKVCTFERTAPPPPFNEPRVNMVTVTAENPAADSASVQDSCTIEK